MEHLTTAMQKIAPHVSPARLVSYWLERDSRLVARLLQELSFVRLVGIRVYLATNQEHLRDAYLMEVLGLAKHVDGIFYSARLGAKNPDMEFFDRIQAAVGLNGEEILLIDDSRQNSQAALKQDGRRFIGQNTVHRLSCAACVHDLPLKNGCSSDPASVPISSV